MMKTNTDELDWLEPDNYGKPVLPDTKEPPLVRLAIDTLTDGEDKILKDWIEKVFPNILDYFSLTPAKGMSLAAAQELAANVPADKKEGIITKLVKHEDQSLAVHLLNAALGGWTLVKLADFDELDQRLYLAGVTLHDLNKIVLKQLGSVRMDGAEWKKYQQGFNTWGEALGLWDFIPKEYWQDVAFLAHNAEDARGQNLTLSNFPNLRHSPGHLMDLVNPVAFADLTASIAHHPEDLETSQRVKAIVRRTLRGEYILRHHKTVENRGLLTQAIHNAVLEQAKAVGWIPFLFFPDGVTYFALKDGTDPDLSELPEKVRSQLLITASKGLGNLISRQTKGIISCSPDMLEVASVDIAAEALIRQTFTILNEKRTPAGGARRDKILKEFPELSDLDWDYPANSIQLDRLAEGLRGLVETFKDYYGISYEDATQVLLKALEINDYYPILQRIPAHGGVPHGWYFLAGNYLKQHPGLNEMELEGIMVKALHTALETLGKPNRPPSFTFLDRYIGQVLNLGNINAIHDFAGELHRYHRNKAKGRRKTEAICATCNSAFDVREEFSSYSNKSITSPKKESRRGICTICQAEQLLRRYSMGRGLSADDEVVYLHLYPDYFFTPETARIMSRAYERFAQSVFSDLDKNLSKHDYNPKYIPRTDIFRIGIDPNDNLKRRVDRVEYPKGQMHGYYLLGVPYLGRKPTDTEAWHMPALLTLVAPLALGVKVVASRAAIPPYDSGADFKETVVLDGVHTYWLHGVQKIHFRLDELQTAIPAAFAFYALTAQAYRDSKGFVVWNALNTVAQSLDTSPLYVFHYMERIIENRKSEKRKGKTGDPTMGVALDLLMYYQLLANYYRGDNLMETMIAPLVDKYACFYRAKGFAAYARLRPLNEAAKRLLESSPSTSQEDLQLMLEGYLLSLVDGVLDNKVEGWIPKGSAKDKVQLVSEFVRFFLNEIFYGYCRGERASLRQYINLIRHAAEAYYIKTYSKKSEE